VARQIKKTKLPGFPATWSPCKRYRYTLWRQWSEGPRVIQFVGLNPSTADEVNNDPTVRRCIGYAQRWGFDGMVMTNLFAYRATDPKVMKAAADPVGPENDKWLLEIRKIAEKCIVCWGSHGVHNGRGLEGYNVLAEAGALHCLKVTQGGFPGHPLYLRGDAKPIKFKL
jgi:hypothetical protein